MRNTLKLSLITLLTGFLALGFHVAGAQQFDKAAYYQVMESGKLDAVENQLKIINSSANINRQAYSGALLMKKAGLIKGPGKKLNVFKDGHSKLEAAIEKEKANTEWRFLRLVIQEHAPKILNYRGDIEEDARVVHQDFKNLSPELQAAILDYRKQSDTLQKLNF